MKPWNFAWRKAKIRNINICSCRIVEIKQKAQKWRKGGSCIRKVQGLELSREVCPGWGRGGDLPHRTGCSGSGQDLGAIDASQYTWCSEGEDREHKHYDTLSVKEGPCPALIPPVELLVLMMVPRHKLSVEGTFHPLSPSSPSPRHQTFQSSGISVFLKSIINIIMSIKWS